MDILTFFFPLRQDQHCLLHSSHLQAVSEACCKQKMLIFHDWQILLQTALCFILFKIESNEQDK